MPEDRPDLVSANTPTEGGTTGEAETPASSPEEKNEPSETGSEPGKTPDEREGFIPRERFDEVNAKLKEERESREALESRIADLESAPTEQPEADKTTDSWSKDEEDEPLTRAEFRKLQEKETKVREETAERTRLDGEMRRLAKEIDGKDGRPAFVEKDIRTYVAAHPEDAHQNPEVVYERMHRDKLDLWRANKINEKQKSAHVETGGKKPASPEKDTSKMSEREHDDFVRQKYSA